MTIHATTRLIILANHREARFFKAKGLKIQNSFPLKNMKNENEGSHEPNTLHNGYAQKLSTPSHFLDPHSAAKEVEKEQFAREVATEALKLATDYDEIILACEPKMLGLLKRNLNGKAVVSETIPLDQISIKLAKLEEKVLLKASQ